MAISVGILVEVVLMIIFCTEEILQRLHFHHECLAGFKFFGFINMLYRLQIFGRCVVDSSAVACSFIFPLTVQAQWVDGVEEHINQKLQIHNITVIYHADGLCIACLVGINILIGGRRGVAICLKKCSVPQKQPPAK